MLKKHFRYLRNKTKFQGYAPEMPWKYYNDFHGHRIPFPSFNNLATPLAIDLINIIFAMINIKYLKAQSNKK
jgi:hypothetical protein